MKYLLIIGDGMADEPVPALGGKTPLQYANIPTMDALASAGIVGTVRTVPEGMAAGSDVAIMSLFGCDPKTYHSGRAPLEAAAAGVKLSEGDVAYRCNMVAFEDTDAPLDEKRLISHSAGSIDGGESVEIVTALFDDPRFKEAAEKAGLTIRPAQSFRHLAVQKAAESARHTGLDPQSPTTDDMTLTPPHDHLGELVGTLLPRGGDHAHTLESLMRLAHGILDRHPLNEKRRADGKLPANGIWFWAEGTACILPDFFGKYGRTGAVISAVALCQGIGALMGLDIIHVEGATGDINTNYEGKAAAAFEALRMRDFAAIHVEAPDECTHDGDVKGKVQAIENIDARVIAPLMEKLAAAGDDYRLLVISDHRTLTSTRGHDGSPVPFIVYDSRRDEGTGLCYSEDDALRGRHLADGTALIDLLFE
jgi:2,3-bisphosphoglycerate-independent phosphoglycerate mutase